MLQTREKSAHPLDCRPGALETIPFSLKTMIAVAFTSLLGAPVKPQPASSGPPPSGTVLELHHQDFSLGGRQLISSNGIYAEAAYTQADVTAMAKLISEDLAKKNPSLARSPEQMSSVQSTLQMFLAGISSLFSSNPVPTIIGKDVLQFASPMMPSSFSSSDAMIDLSALQSLCDRSGQPFSLSAGEIASSIKNLCDEVLFMTSHYSLGESGSITARYGMLSGNGAAKISLGGIVQDALISYNKTSGSFSMTGMSLGVGSAGTITLAPKPAPLPGVVRAPLPGFVDWANYDARMDMKIAGNNKMSYLFNPASGAFEGAVSVGRAAVPATLSIKKVPVAGTENQFTQTWGLRFGQGSLKDVNLEFHEGDPVSPLRGTITTEAGPATVSLARLSDGTNGLSASFSQSSLLRGTWSWNPQHDTWEGTIGAGKVMPAELTISRLQPEGATGPGPEAVKLHLLGGSLKDSVLTYTDGALSGTMGTSLGTARVTLSGSTEADHTISATFDNPLLTGLAFTLDASARTYVASLERNGRPYKIALSEDRLQEDVREISVMMPRLLTGFSSTVPSMAVKLSGGSVSSVAVNYGNQGIKVSAGMGGAWGSKEKPLSVQSLISEIDALYDPQPVVAPGQTPPVDTFLPVQGAPLGYYLSFMRQKFGTDVSAVTMILDETGNVDRARFMLKGKAAVLHLGYCNGMFEGELEVNKALLGYDESTGIFSGGYTLVTSKGNLTGVLSVGNDGIDSTQVTFRTVADSPFPVCVELKKIQGQDKWECAGTFADHGTVTYKRDGEILEWQVGFAASW